MCSGAVVTPNWIRDLQVETIKCILHGAVVKINCDGAMEVICWHILSSQ